MSKLPDTLDPTILQRIQAMGEHFEKAWHAGKKPRIEDYLKNVSDPVRAAVLRLLLSRELLLLARQGTVADAQAYLTRFPKDAAIVVDAFSVAARETTTEAARTNSGTARPTGNAPTTQPKRLGRFELLKLLGQGGCGKVFKARDPQLDRTVALKVPLKEVLQSDEERERFLREARAAAAIQHPNICPVYEVCQEGPQHYIVMAFIEGKSLAEVLKERKTPMPAKQAALLVRKLALTLAVAHERGVIHRDLKPANIMVDRERQDLIIMDFGLARRITQGDARLTADGAVMGTPAYMPPEQAAGKIDALGPACDIYALGVILYELITGRLPFEGPAMAVLSQVLTQPPPAPSSVRGGVDPALEKICLRAMAKEPGQRYPSMKALAEALGDYARGTKAAPEPESKAITAPAPGESLNTARVLEQIVARLDAGPARSHRGRWLIAGGLAAVAAAVVIAAILMSGPKTVNVENNTVSVQLGGLTFVDKSMHFYLDGKEISAERLAGKLDLTVGEHKLEMKRDGKLVEERRFTVRDDDDQRDIQVVAEPSPEVKKLAVGLEEEDFNKRVEAIAALGKLGDRTAVPLLCRVLPDKHLVVRGAAAEALKQLGDPAAVPALMQRVADDRWDLGGAFHNDPGTSKDPALAALRALDKTRVTEALGEGLKSRNVTVREWAAEKLADQDDRKSLDLLIEALGQDAAGVREVAAGSLGKRGDKAAQEALIGVLIDKHVGVRGAAAVALQKLGDKAAVPALVQRVADERWDNMGINYNDPATSKDPALAALRSLDKTRVADALGAAVKARNSNVRAWAVERMATLDDKKSFDLLVEALKDDGEYGIRINASNSLGKRGDKAAVVPLIEALNDKHVGVRGSAAAMLGQLGDPTAVPALIKRVADDRWDVLGPNYNDPSTSKEPALAALRALAKDKVPEALGLAAKSTNANVRGWAEGELAKMKK